MKWLYIEFVTLEPKYRIFLRTFSRDVVQSAFVIGLDLINTRRLILPRRKLIADYFYSKKNQKTFKWRCWLALSLFLQCKERFNVTDQSKRAEGERWRYHWTGVRTCRKTWSAIWCIREIIRRNRFEKTRKWKTSMTPSRIHIHCWKSKLQWQFYLNPV